MLVMRLPGTISRKDAEIQRGQAVDLSFERVVETTARPH